MENYILRIYRRDAQHAERVAGVIEDVENGQTRSFRTLGELMALLAEPCSLVTEQEKLEPA